MLKRRRRRRSTVRAVTSLVPPAPKRARHHLERRAYLQFHRGEISHREFVRQIGGI